MNDVVKCVSDLRTRRILIDISLHMDALITLWCHQNVSLLDLISSVDGVVLFLFVLGERIVNNFQMRDGSEYDFRNIRASKLGVLRYFILDSSNGKMGKNVYSFKVVLLQFNKQLPVHRLFSFSTLVGSRRPGTKG